MIPALGIIFGLGILIFIHELGHFIAAKSMGILVEEFSLGFGPAIVKFKIKETEYKIAAIPVGGYIKMKGEDPDSELTGSKDEFLSRKTHEKIIVALAGPLANIILAAAIYPVIFMGIGEKEAVLTPYAQIAGTIEGSAAESAGIIRKDIIEKINETEIRSPSDITPIVSGSAGNTLFLTVRRGDEVLKIAVRPNKREKYDYIYYELGVYFKIDPVIGPLPKKSNAYRAGLREGDIIVKSGGREVFSFTDIFEDIVDGSALLLTVKRSGELLDITVPPVLTSGFNEEGKIRKAFRYDLTSEYRIVKSGFGEGISRSLNALGSDFLLIYNSLRIIIKHPKEARHLGGFITIGYILSKSIREGIAEYLAWIGMISVNLAVVNMLPLIITDGGLILMFMFEFLTRRKMKKKERAVLQYTGFALLLLLFLFIMKNDIMRYL